MSKWFGLLLFSACLWWGFASCLIARVEAQAAPDNDYQHVIKRALAAFQVQHLDEARRLFQQAHALEPSARTLRGLGVTAFAQNRFTLAKPELEAALIDPRKPLTQAQQDEVTDCLSWMDTNLGTLQLRLSPAYALALVDSHAVNTGDNLLELGAHQLEVRASGFETFQQRFEIQPGAILNLNVALQPSAATDQAPVSSPPPAVAFDLQQGAAASGPTDAKSGSNSMFTTWWFWTATGVLIVGAVSALVILTLPQPHGHPVQT